MQEMTIKQLVELAQSALDCYGVASKKIRLLKTHQYATMFCVETADKTFTLRLFPANTERLTQALLLL